MSISVMLSSILFTHFYLLVRAVANGHYMQTNSFEMLVSLCVCVCECDDGIHVPILSVHISICPKIADK